MLKNNTKLEKISNKLKDFLAIVYSAFKRL